MSKQSQRANAKPEPLPPGQRSWPAFPRFGLPPYAKIWPEVSPNPTIAIDGDVGTAITVPLADLDALERQDQISDFHCVTTWTRRDLHWSGYRFRDFYREIIVPRATPEADVAHILLIGADGYRIDLHLEDALRPDVLLADRLDGQPLPLAHGAPVRLVSPAQYGYKNARHIRKIILTTAPKSRGGLRGKLVHPRGRVALEERSQGLPGWMYRWIYRAILPVNLWYFRLHDRTDSEDT